MRLKRVCVCAREGACVSVCLCLCVYMPACASHDRSGLDGGGGLAMM